MIRCTYEYGKIRRIRVYANICNKEGAILYILNDWKNYTVSEGMYYSFSIYCSSIDRYINIDELEYVELYLGINEKDT